ncbi:MULTISPECIES: hypothetical protein [Halorubrum]|jgi:hypothetical protein|nr:hypothetical protein [Halorubrum lacusprofundi]
MVEYTIGTVLPRESGESSRMYREISWAVPADPYILEELSSYDGWQTAKNLSINTGFSHQWTGQRCKVFVEHGLAKRHETEPAYRITERGKKVVAGEIASDSLD